MQVESYQATSKIVQADSPKMNDRIEIAYQTVKAKDENPDSRADMLEAYDSTMKHNGRSRIVDDNDVEVVAFKAEIVDGFPFFMADDIEAMTPVIAGILETLGYDEVIMVHHEHVSTDEIQIVYANKAHSAPIEELN